MVGGGTPSASDSTNFASGDGIPWITPADLSGYKQMFIEKGKRNLSQKGYDSSSAVLLPAGSVVFSSRAPIGYVAIASNDLATNQGFKSFILPNGIHNKFLFFYLKSIKDIAEQNATGTTFKELSGTATANLPLLIAPLPEQIRIANKLETLLRRVDAGWGRLERVPKLIKQFRQSVLSAAASGELTREWRGGADPHWAEHKTIELCEPDRALTYGVIKLGDETPGGVPCLRTSNVRRLRYDLNGLKRISPSLSDDYARTKLRGGEVLVNVRGSLDGVAVVPEEFIGWNVSREVAVLPLDSSRIEPHYAAMFIASEQAQKWLRETYRGVAYTGINIEDLKNLPLPLPSLPEQAEIVRRVEALFTIADRLEARCQAALTAFDRLTPALLAKAFRGELVPQDPNDEPASVLLERIQAQRASAPGKVKRGRPAKTSPETGGEQPAKRRGRPRKTPADDTGAAPGIPEAGSYEEAVQLLEGRRLVSTD